MHVRQIKLICHTDCKTVSQACSERFSKLHAVIQLQDSESSSKHHVYAVSCAFRVFISQSMPPPSLAMKRRVSFILITAIEIE